MMNSRLKPEDIPPKVVISPKSQQCWPGKDEGVVVSAAELGAQLAIPNQALSSERI